MFEQTQFNILRSWLIRATELPEIIQSHGSAPRPSTDYGLLNLTRSGAIGRPIEQHFRVNPLHTGVDDQDHAPIWEYHTQEWEFTWSFNVYSRNPLNVMGRINPWFHSDTGREMLKPLNLFAMGGFKRLPEKVNENWQDRAMTEMKVRTYVCTDVTNHDSDEILMGRVPIDVVDVLNFNIDTGNEAIRNEQVNRP